MNSTDFEAVRIINSLPRRFSAYDLVECLGSEDFDQMVFDIVFFIYCIWCFGVNLAKFVFSFQASCPFGKSNFLSSRK